MDQSERNQPSRSGVDGRGPLDHLREQISAASQSSSMALAPKPLRAVLGMLDAYLVSNDARIVDLETRLAVAERRQDQQRRSASDAKAE